MAVRYPLAVKLILIMAVSLALSLGAITLMVSFLTAADVRLTAEDNNFAENTHLAEAINLVCKGNPELINSKDVKDILAVASSQSFVTNSKGALVSNNITPDAAVFSPFVRGVFEEKSQSGQHLYTALNEKQYFCAFSKLDNGVYALVSVSAFDDVQSLINRTTMRNIYASLAALLVSVLLVLLYSRTISKPLARLIGAARQIESGDYDVKLEKKTNDELGTLTKSFISMGHGLANFEKFTNKKIVERARKGLLSRAGEMKDVTICFTFIRDFSGISEGMKPDEVVRFTNFFLNEIVPCITSTGGAVDKFLTQSGMVIMAIWGAIESSGSKENDAYNCVCSCIKMRRAIKNLNAHINSSPVFKDNVIKGKEKIKIGCGVNSGEVVVGQIGSEKRMEFTVIGDAVNLAARFEGPNDLFDTDILISENTYRLIHKYLAVEEMEKLEVKGKSEPLRVFAVVNLRDPRNGGKIIPGPASLKEVRAQW